MVEMPMLLKKQSTMMKKKMSSTNLMTKDQKSQ